MTLQSFHAIIDVLEKKEMKDALGKRLFDFSLRFPQQVIFS